MIAITIVLSSYEIGELQMSLKIIALVICVTIFGGVVTSLATQQHGSHDANNNQFSSGGNPSETGQSAFAAIAEIVRILEAKPETDWSTINIQVLRNHLVDMSELTLKAAVERVTDEDGITFIVTGKGGTLRAIKAMVPAHAKELEKMAGWSASTTVQPDGVRLLMQPNSDKERAKILGLGFFGLMATGSHHQPHHLGMATGQMTHH